MAYSLTLPHDLFVDPEGEALDYQITLADGKVLPTWLTFNRETLTLSGTAGNSDVGVLTFKVTAFDPAGLNSSTE